MKQKICVIGCGWLGFSLAKKLMEINFEIHGSTTSKDKIKHLEEANIRPFLIKLSSEGVIGDISACLSHCQTLILNIPPGLRKNPNSDYIAKMKHLIAHIETSPIENVLFISSTSVYDDDESCPVITENTPTSNSKIASQIVTVEALFQKNKNFKTTILRFGGLFAEDRHPAKILSGKTQLKNGSAPVNLIHRTDCIGIIISILKHGLWNETFNASTTPHPTKKDYYSEICRTLAIPIPEYENQIKSKGKIINSEKLVRLLNYEFKVKL